MGDSWINNDYEDDNASEEESSEEVSEGEYLNNLSDLCAEIAEECETVELPLKQRMSVGAAFLKMFRNIGGR
jgi:hypothetical protein